MGNNAIDTRAKAIKDAFEMVIPPEDGLSYRLDLQVGSEMRSTPPYPRVQGLPIYPHGYGYFIAGPEHYTIRKATAGMGLYQIFLTYSGKGRFLIDGREYVVTPNTLFMLRCGTDHHYESVGGVWEHEWVNFTGSSCETYYNLINPGDPVVYDMGSNHEILTGFREIRDAFERQDLVSYVHSSTCIINLLDAFYAMVMEQKRMNMADRRGNVERSVKYIEEHYMEKISLDDLAKIAYLSKYYYTRAFDKIIGMTPYEYLNAVRISKAMNLMIVTDLSVDEVGWRVGFRGSRNLIRQFKKTIGVTPGEYRRSAAGWNIRTPFNDRNGEEDI